MLRLERQDQASMCDHANPAQCHAHGPDRFGFYWHYSRAYHVWDTDRDDYATGTGPGEFRTRREARDWISHATTRPT